MSKFLKLSLLFVISVLVIASCKKDESKSKTELLCGKKWVMTASTVNPPIDFFGIPISDFYSFLEDCEKDNFLQFNTDGTCISDEGATMCDSTDVQTETGTWTFNENETTISASTDGGISANLVKLTASDLEINYAELDTTENVTYTFTMKFKAQ